MDDVISRQKALNVIKRMRAYIGHNMERAVGAAFIEILDDVWEDIGRLPSAQPTFDARDTQYNLPIGTDCISRQAAIDALHMHLMYRMGTDSNKKRLDDWINGVPSVQPERTPMQELLDVTADRDYWKAQCHSYEMTINRLTESAQPEIIRCKDCKYAEYIDDVQTLWCTECGQGRTVAPDDFCSYADRRKETT